MLWYELILFILAAPGMTSILVEGSIFQGVRDFFGTKQSWLCQQIYSLISCQQCCGFWTGVFLGSLLIDHFSIPLYFLCGCASSFLSMLSYLIMTYLQAKSV